MGCSFVPETDKSFLTLAHDINAEFGIIVDHFHVYDDVGDITVFRVTSSEGVVRYLTLLGFVPEPVEFQYVLAHKFHGKHETLRPDVFERQDDSPPAPRPESGFAKFMRRFVAW